MLRVHPKSGNRLWPIRTPDSVKLIYHVPWLPSPARQDIASSKDEADARYQENVMAVDYFHRLLVSGRPADVRAFRDAIYREDPRTIADETWTSSGTIRSQTKRQRAKKRKRGGRP